MDVFKCLDIYIKYLKFEKNLTHNTVISYEKDIESLIGFLKEKNISDPNQVNIKIFRTYLKSLEDKRYSNNTMIRKYSSFANFFKFLEDNSYTDNQLTQHMNTPRKHPRLYNYLTKRELNEVLNQVEINNEYGIRDRALLEIIYSTGARVGEIENLKLEDIHMDKKEVVLFGKGRKQRIAYLNNYALKWIEKYYEIRKKFGFDKDKGYSKCKYLFLNRFGGRLSSRSIREIFKKYLKKTGIKKDISTHGIRHSFATHLLDEGAGIREIQELLGHENISTTQIYSHLNIRKLKNDYRNFHPRAK